MRFIHRPVPSASTYTHSTGADPCVGPPLPRAVAEGTVANVVLTTPASKRSVCRRCLPLAHWAAPPPTPWEEASGPPISASPHVHWYVISLS